MENTVVAAPSDPFYQKWVEWGCPGGGMGFVIGDLYHTGIDDIVKAGNNWTIAIKGTDATLTNEQRIRWTASTPGVVNTTQPQMADLDGDSYLEIIVPMQVSPTGFYILSHNGTVIDKIVPNIWGGQSDNGPVIADIDGDGIPTIFFASMAFVEINDESNSTGVLASYKYDSGSHKYVELAHTKLWHPCSGGLSLADANRDGEFELFIGDRDMYLGAFPDRGYGGGVVAFWAKNLTEIWRAPNLLVSSGKPMLADIDDDGRLEVIVTLQAGGLAVLDCRDGSPIRETQSLATINNGNPVSGHYQSSIYDINHDGHLDILMADGDHNITQDLVIWDLVDWREVARIPGNFTNFSYPYNYTGFTGVGRMLYGPQIGPVTSNGAMNIVAANFTHIFVFNGTHDPSIDGTYPLVWMSSNLSATDTPEVARGNTIIYPVMKDIDDDGYIEIIAATQGGRIFCFGTQALEQSTPRTEIQFYSELRLGVAEYVPTAWELSRSVPIISATSPSDWQSLIRMDTAKLNFTLKAPSGHNLSYYVTTSPNVGEGSATGLSDGTYSVDVSGLNYATTYTWHLSVTDGTTWTNRTIRFRTEYAGRTNTSPTQGNRLLQSSLGNLVARNQSTHDADGDPVTNIYHWTVNGSSIASLLMPFNTRSQTRVIDYSSYRNHGTIVGDVSWIPSGKVGGAFMFNGGCIEISDSNTLDGDDSWTEMSAEAWVNVNPDQGGYATRILFKQPVYELGITASGKLYAGIWTYRWDSSRNATIADYVSISASITKSIWHHVAFTYRSGDGLRLFIDGQQVAYGAHSGPVQRSVQPLTIGSFTYYRGMIDEVAIYPKRLSSQQIAQDYQQSRTGLSSSSTIVSQEIQPGENWDCQVIPDDGYVGAILSQDNDAPVTTNDYDGLWHKLIFTINLTASDIGSSVDNTYYIVNNGAVKSLSDNGQPIINLEGANNTLEYWSIDLAGNVEKHHFLTEIKLDQTSPAGLININGGTRVTNSTNVVLNLDASDSLSGVGQVRFSNYWVWGSTSWESFSSTKAWTLDAWTGNQTVYYQIKDNANNTRDYQATILVDVSSPKGSLVIGDGTQTTTDSSNVVLHLTYSDLGSGVNKIRLGTSANGGSVTWGSWTNATSTVTYNLGSGTGSRTVHYQIRDNAGLISETYTKSITVTSASVFDQFPYWIIPIIAAGIAIPAIIYVLKRKK
jgi:hypothetical protein